MIQSDLLALPGLRHGFFTRQGGVSQGIYQSLNCGLGSQDDPAAVRHNRALVAEQLGCAGDQIITCYQIHSAEVVQANAAWTPADMPKADAIVTDRPGLAIGALAADCAPVLLADAEAGVIGCAHAGWKGAINGVVPAAIAAMEQIGAQRARIRAVIGPCIGPNSYEVGQDFADHFTARAADYARFFRPASRPGHAMFDLPGFLLAQIGGLGLAAFGHTGHDTLPDDTQFFSYRRVTLAGGGDYGRMISAIALT